MKGVVQLINRQRGLTAVLNDDGLYSILEIQGSCPIEEGDEVLWIGWYPLGDGSIKNLSQGKDLSVVFQDHSVSILNLRRKLLME